MNQPLRDAHACAVVAKQLAEHGHVHEALGSLAQAVAGIIEHLNEISAEGAVSRMGRAQLGVPVVGSLDAADAESEPPL